MVIYRALDGASGLVVAARTDTDPYRVLPTNESDTLLIGRCLPNRHRLCRNHLPSGMPTRFRADLTRCASFRLYAQGFEAGDHIEELLIDAALA